ncbi:MAG: hypothetical protein FJ146_01965 [Deltaproteobacteria bacterium]|nr:hypothetical protein [Deltaproteobacteria bacterium]
MKLSNEINILKEFSAVEGAVSKLLPSPAPDDCHGGFELVGGRCIAACPAGPSDVMGATGDCMAPQVNAFGSYFVFIFSTVIWFYVIYRMSLHRRL